MDLKKYDDLFITTTDTLVGIGIPVKCNKIELLYEIKKRNLEKKIIILVSSINQARQFEEWNQQAEELAKKYWPGNTTLIVNEQGFRMPNQKGLLNLLEKEGPCWVTSANISGEKSLDLEEAKKKFFMIKKVYNFGVGSNIPSKIIRVETLEELR
ncbi:Sua5/YciO/YrdC/YwlC family protein [Mesomycoplasma molare]|uniref:L-threonylcarbamoyladenylate synthase n=1 Tax=Mesomycoplasma molare TaxID=171288 RepID=A0ABY5TVT4_9BACT|nr:Sua5/YciO/YrdC/YwlC family protein [Mesomycoplasma molare]UWD34330.1 Sua5/YciO/YrdC/YwlC family protein [Mesomycoplasma molare]